MMGKKKKELLEGGDVVELPTEEIEVPDVVTITESDIRITKMAAKSNELDLKLAALKGGFIQLGRRLQRIVMDFTAVKSSSVSLNYALNNCESNLVTFAQALNALNIEDEKK